METEATRLRGGDARVAGRAKNVAPALAAKLPIENCNLILDVGGGTGIYSIAPLQRYPNLCDRVQSRLGTESGR